jgi:deoxyribonuclease IV
MVYSKPRLLLGAHMSIAGGIEQALHRGAELGCTAIQLFTTSNRQWTFKEFDDTTAALFKKTQHEAGIIYVVSHASYLINVGSASAQTVQKSIKGLDQELKRCQQLNIPYVVLHPGSGSGLKSTQDCIKHIADSLNEVFHNYKGPTMLLLELMAGQGNSVGDTFEQLALLRMLIEHKNRTGICFDTCHAWAAGYDFSNSQSYDKMWQAFDTIIGIEHLKVIHMNDSVKPLGSHVDRHADIGKGTLGLEPFRLLMNDERFFSIPKILETPKDIPGEDAANIAILKSLLNQKNNKVLAF